MDTLNLDSDFGSREKLFATQRPNETYEGTAEQDTVLLKDLLANQNQTLIPFPSSDIYRCEEFYSHPEIAKYLTGAFEDNAITACIVTGTETPQNDIRRALQTIYRNTKPKDGVTFTAAEHKAIHDAAYKAAGCEEDSANISGWIIVNTFPSLPNVVVEKSIDWFGECTVSGR